METLKYSIEGKFQMQVLPRCGHCVHEDAPDKVSEVTDSSSASRTINEKKVIIK